MNLLSNEEMKELYEAVKEVMRNKEYVEEGEEMKKVKVYGKDGEVFREYEADDVRIEEGMIFIYKDEDCVGSYTIENILGIEIE